jgi:hypothetical protein
MGDGVVGGVSLYPIFYTPLLISRKKMKRNYNKKVVDKFGKSKPWSRTVCFCLSLTLLLALV